MQKLSQNKKQKLMLTRKFANYRLTDYIRQG